MKVHQRIFNMIKTKMIKFNKQLTKIKINENNNRITISTDESYEFSYDYEEAKDDENIIYPKEVTWSCSGGNINSNGLFNADNAGKYTVTVTGTFSSGQKTTASIKVEVTGPDVVEVAPTPSPNPSPSPSTKDSISQEELDSRLEKYTKAIQTAILKNTPPKHPGFQKEYEGFSSSGASANGRISYKRVVSEYTEGHILQSISYSGTVMIFHSDSEKEYWIDEAYKTKDKWQNGKAPFYDCSDITETANGLSWNTSRIVTKDNINLANGASLNNSITFFIIENDYRINCSISVSFLEQIIDYVPSDFTQANVQKLIDDVQAEINKVK